MNDYDPQNVFAKILRGEIPNHTIHEDEHTLAFMDVMPQVDGHCLVIPKTASRGFLDASPQSLATAMATIQRVARAAVTAMQADGFQIRQYNEVSAGQTVFHLHFHILPMRESTLLKPHTGNMADHAVLAEQARRIRAALSD